MSTRQNPRNSKGRDGVSAAKREQVFELRIAGASFRQIGEQIGLSYQRCFELYRAELKERAARTAELADTYVQQHLERLEKLILAHWAQRGDSAHAAVILRAMDQQAKLCGLHTLRVEHSGQVEVAVEDAEARKRRIIAETADRVARMTPEELAAEAASL